jgi:hypothetical protein
MYASFYSVPVSISSSTLRARLSANEQHAIDPTLWFSVLRKETIPVDSWNVSEAYRTGGERTRTGVLVSRAYYVITMMSLSPSLSSIDSWFF